MKTEQLFISSKDLRYKEVIEMTENFTSELNLEKKTASRIRLLVEETLGMVQILTEDFIAYISLESVDKQVKINLDVKTEMDLEKKRDLISVSKSGKNSAVKSLMGQIGEFFEKSLLDFSANAQVSDEYRKGIVPYGEMGVGTGVEGTDASFVWSLYHYKNALAQDEQGDDDNSQEILDELEKSIVAKIADDVIVGVKKDRASLTIIKNLD